jgi:hypothetical protein
MSLKSLKSGQRHKKKLHSGAKTYNNNKKRLKLVEISKKRFKRNIKIIFKILKKMPQKYQKGKSSKKYNNKTVRTTAGREVPKIHRKYQKLPNIKI